MAVFTLAGLAASPGLASAGTWSPVDTSPATSSVEDVWCEALWTCLEVGSAIDHFGVSRAQSVVWGQGHPTPMPPGASSSELSGVTCMSMSDCLAVGSHVAAGTTKTLAMSWDGSSWSLVSTPGPQGATSSELSGVSCASSSMCVAVGSFVSAGVTKTLAMRWDGFSWSVAATPNPAGAGSSELSDVSCPDAAACTAAGSYVDSAGTRRTLVLDFALGTWTIVSSPTPTGASSSELADVVCVPLAPCTAVGSYRDSSGARKTLAMRRTTSGGSWVIAPTPNPSASWSSLSGLACLSSSECVAAGGFGNGSADTPLVVAWDGSSWSQQPITPTGGSDAELVAVSCPSATDCEAAGSVTYGEFPARNLFYILEEGSGDWYEYPASWLRGILYDVSCVSATTCLGVGSFGPIDRADTSDDSFPIGWRVNNGDWSATPTPSELTWFLAGVSCTAADACTAVGSRDDGTFPSSPDSGTLVERWDGLEWTVQPSPNPNGSDPSLAGVSCPSSATCVAVGNHRNSSNRFVPFAEAWNGSSWSIQPLPLPDPSTQVALSDVSCTSSSWCVAVGKYTYSTAFYYPFSTSDPHHALIERWNGSSWSVDSIPTPPGAVYTQLSGVSCTSSSACTAVGSYRYPTGGTLRLVLHWDGASWAVQAASNSPGVLYDVSCFSSSACVAVGNRYSTATGAKALAMAWDGGSWSTEFTPSLNGAGASLFRSVSCTSAEHCTAAGYAYAGAQYEPIAMIRQAGAGEPPEDDPPDPEALPIKLYEPAVVNRTGATLYWSRWPGTGFGGYEVHRGAEAGFAPSAATRLARIDNIDVTSYRDDSAAPGSTVFYKLVTAGPTSNEQRAVLPAEGEPARAILQPPPDRGQAMQISPPPPTYCRDHITSMSVGYSGGHRALLRWDLRDIPPDSRVHSARLMLHRGSPQSAFGRFAVRPVTREWRESSKAGLCDGATWTHAHAGVSWTTPGGDADPVVATADVAALADKGWSEWDVSTVVRDWIAGRRANHGFMVSAVTGGNSFSSDDFWHVPAERPKLEIVFDDPEPVHRPTVSLIAPRGGERVRDTVAVEASAGDDRQVERVEFLLDGGEFGEDASAPYKVNWDSRAVANGAHTLRARAVDDVGNVALSESVVVEVANFDPPQVTLTDPPTGYGDTVKADGPAGYWRLGEASGTVAQDASGNGRNGTYAGSFTLDQAGLIADDPSRSVRLGSGSGNVTLSNLSGALGSQFTAEAWIKHPGLTANGTESRVVSRNAGGTGGWKLGVRRTSTGAQEAFFSLGGATAPVSIAPSPTNPPVYHLVGVYDGAAIRLYLDGSEVAQASATGAANTSAAPAIGGATAAELQVDDVALYPAALSGEQVKTHFEVGQGRAFWVAGQNELRATASAAAGRTLREVVFLVDDQLVGRDGTAPYSVTWSTGAAGAPVPDGPHVVTARAIDDHERDGTSDAVEVNVGNNTVPEQQAKLTAASPLPETLVDEPGAPAVDVDVRIKNTGSAPITSGAAVLRYRWVRPDGSFDDSVSGNYMLSGSIAPGAEQIVRASVRPPSLPPGLARSRFTLRFDLRDTGGGQTWWAERGNPPLEHSVMVQRAGAIGLGLERYYQYDGEALGGGMSQLVNLASGNNIVRFSPFEAPGRGLSTVVDLTYNAQSGETKGSALGDGWLLSVSSLSPFGEPLRCGVGTDAELKPDKCEEYALKDQQDLPSLALELVDADGTVHRFSGRRTGGRTFWRAPQGLHLYVHQLEADEQPACDIVEPGMAYQPDIQPQIRALWAFTRPDGTTFYYQRNGWPTGVADRNGNCVDLELTAPPSKPDRVRVAAVTDAAGVADPALRPRRTFTLDYYDDEQHPLGGKTDFPKVRAIRDHNGSELSFEYYKDDRPLRITQEGGTTPDGLSAPSRSWVMTYADWDIDEEETVANIPNAAARANPDPTITDNSYLLYSVRDPLGRETQFTYHGEKPQEQKDNAGKLKRRVDRAHATTTYNYDLATDTTTVDLPMQRQSRYAFDAEGSVLRMIDKVSSTREETTHVSWTADRHVFKVTEPTGRFTEFEYSQNGYLTKRWDQLRRLNELQYEHIPVDDDDQASGWVDPGRTIPHISQLTKRITPRGKQWLFDHDDATGNLLELEDPEGFASRYQYDGTGNLTLSRDGLDSAGNLPAGEPSRTTGYAEHDANGLPTKVTDALGKATRFCSDDDGLLRWVQDARHAGSPLPADWSGCFEHAGRAFRSYFDYDPFQRLARTSEPKSTEHNAGTLLWTHARYDANDNVIEDFGPHEGASFRVGEGTRTSLTYDAMDRPTSETLFDFDTSLQGQELTSVEREETTKLEYDQAGRLERLTTPRGVATPSVANDFSTEYAYDLLDRPLVVTRNGIAEARHTHLCYDEAGDLRSVTKPREAPIAVTCGTDGAASGTPLTERREYTGAHEPHKVISPAGNVTTYAYDADGNLAETTDPEGAKVTRSYDGRDLVVEAVEDFETGGSPQRLTTRFAYDAVGNLRHLYSPRAVEAAGGSPTPESDFVKTAEYDGLDRPIRELLPRKRDEEDQRYVHRRFDAVGNLTHITVPVEEGDLGTILGSAEETRKWVTSYTHFDPGWIRTSEDINGLVQFDYSPEGWQTKRTPARTGKDTSRDYYRDGLLRTFTDEGGNLLLRRYDLDGNPTFMRDAGVSSPRKAITLDLDHNGFGEIASTTAREEGRHRKVTTYTYWLDGLVRTRADDREEDDQSGELVQAARRHEFSYDPDGRPSVHLDLGREAGAGDDMRTTHSYFPTGRERERVVEDWVSGSFEPRQTTRREYFANGLLRTLRTWGGAAEDPRLRESHTLAYRDPGGLYVGHLMRDEFLRASPAPGTPCSTAAGMCTQRWSYDGDDRLIREDNGRGKVTGYKLTPAGGIEEKFDADTEDVFYSADFDGTRVVERTMDGLTQKLFYDGEGNLDCITTAAGTAENCGDSGDPSPNVLEDFSYDYRNRLEVWKRPAANRSTVYEHDALDRPIAETEAVAGQTTRHELSYIGATRHLAEEQETGQRQKTRSYSHDAFGRLNAMSYRSGGGATHELSYAYDPRGSVSMLLDDTGQPKAAYGYTAYGEPDAALTAERLPDSGQSPDPTEQVNPFRYSAKRSDALSGTIDMGARQFGPTIGQFLQTDRYDDALADLGLSSDPLTGNRYSLAGGNPISFVEVDGHIATTGDQDSANVQLQTGETYNRETGKYTSGPNTGGGPGSQPGGDSGFVDRSDPTASSQPWLARRIAKSPAAPRVLGQGVTAQELERYSASYLFDRLNEDVIPEESVLWRQRHAGEGPDWFGALVGNHPLEIAVNFTPFGRANQARRLVGGLLKGGDEAADAARLAPSYRSFTTSNFRENLARRTGGIPANAEAHHVFPRKLQTRFERQGIDINNPRYGAWWQATAHRRASYGYNQQWGEFLSANPSREEILNFGRRLSREHGLTPGF